MLTLQKLKDMKPNTIIATGIDHNMKWVAKRGGFHDWCIYYGDRDDPVMAIVKEGDKMSWKNVSVNLYRVMMKRLVITGFKEELCG